MFGMGSMVSAFDETTNSVDLHHATIEELVKLRQTNLEFLKRPHYTFPSSSRMFTPFAFVHGHSHEEPLAAFCQRELAEFWSTRVTQNPQLWLVIWYLLAVFTISINVT
ncbi:hypothetical protein PIIN_07087 [Serendipita indica DSM 11827]|uniref:Uncharacterized protein n=1 Tax=Serendipita indica (strain DSM 11827) TaxID=1109443 RepID=G4TP90_SERID|nr:hypothetical protein PIIN_07087 [Serendipita indica DSM 11827]